MPHFHVVIEAAHLPQEIVQASWNKHARFLSRSDTDATVLGHVWLTAGDADTVPCEASARLARYLFKVPRFALPRWVSQCERTLHRYGASRGFWGRVRPRRPHKGSHRTSKSATPKTKTVCGSAIEVFEEQERLDRTTGELQIQKVWIAKLDVPFDQIRHLSLTHATLPALIEAMELELGRPVRVLRRRRSHPTANLISPSQAA
jgi:hypothetical protein